MSKKPDDFGKIDKVGKIPTLRQVREGDRASPRVPREDPGFLSHDDCGQIRIPDPFRERNPNQGRKEGELILYDAAQTYNYPSQSARYERSFNLVPNQVVQREGKPVYRFCSSRAPQGFWEVTEFANCTYVSTGGKILYLLCPPTGYRLQVDTDCEEVTWTQISGRAVILDPPKSPNPELIILDDLSSREPIILRASLPEDPLIADDLVIRTAPTEEMTSPSSSVLLSGADASPLLQVTVVREAPGEPERAFQWVSGSIAATWDLPSLLPEWIIETRWQKNTTGQYEDCGNFPHPGSREFNIELNTYYRILSIFNVQGGGVSIAASRTFYFVPTGRIYATSRLLAPSSTAVKSVSTDYGLSVTNYQETDTLSAPSSAATKTLITDYPLSVTNYQKTDALPTVSSTAIKSVSTYYELGSVVIG